VSADEAEGRVGGWSVTLYMFYNGTDLLFMHDSLKMGLQKLPDLYTSSIRYDGKFLRRIYITDVQNKSA
jgi:hypothetical protein